MRRSIRIGRAPYVLGRTAYPRRGVCCFLYANLPSRPRKTAAGRSHAQAGGSGPVSRVQADPIAVPPQEPLADRTRPGMPSSPPPSFPFGLLPSGSRNHAFNAPTLLSHSRQVPIGTFVKFALSGLFRPVLRPGTPCQIGQTVLSAALERPAEWSIQEPFWERPAGPKHTRAEQVES